MPKVSRPPRTKSKPASAPARGAWATYLELSKRPLQVLLFLLPLLVLYELGTLLFLNADGMREIVRARFMLSQVLDAFGAVGFHLPPILLCVVLLVWHAATKPAPGAPRSAFRGDVMVGMGLESFLWAIPLIVFASVLSGSAPPLALAQAAGPPPHELSLMARLTLAIGAGLYEELVFRWMLIALLHLVVKDLLGASEHWAYAVAIVVSAVTFALYHNLRIGPEQAFSVPLFLAYAVGGAYFAIIFVLRGFGIVVGAHATYDIIALTLVGR